MQDATAYGVSGIPAARGAEWVHHSLRRSLAPLSAATHPEATIPAYVNHGRWVADCPDCNNAQLACKTDHRFLCDECGNVVIGRLWRPVEWPADVQRIENLLTERPVANQNWVPGENLPLLAIDNLENMGRIK